MEHKIIELERFIQKLARLGIPEHRQSVFLFRPHCKHPMRVLSSLWEHLDRAIPEATGRRRRGLRHKQATVLTILALAELNWTWIWGPDGFWCYARSLTQGRRKALRCCAPTPDDSSFRHQNLPPCPPIGDRRAIQTGGVGWLAA